VTAQRRTPPEIVNHSARASGEAKVVEGDSRKLVDLGMELVQRMIPVSLVYPRHSPARNGCPASHEGDGCSLESFAEEALALASLVSLAQLVSSLRSLQLRC
jgi:hypothetical protein